MRKTTHPFTEQDNIQNRKPGFICGSKLIPQVLFYTHCWLYCFLCVYCLGRQGYLAGTVAGLNSVDQTTLDSAVIRLPRPPEPRDSGVHHRPGLCLTDSTQHLWPGNHRPTTLSRKGVVPRLASPAHYCRSPAAHPKSGDPRRKITMTQSLKFMDSH